MMDKTKTIKSGQEQAVASWINYLNQERLNQLNKALNKEQLNLNEAMATINETLNKISVDIVNNGKGRGGASGDLLFQPERSEIWHLPGDIPAGRHGRPAGAVL